jgi:hypothetical protein
MLVLEFRDAKDNLNASMLPRRVAAASFASVIAL